MQLQKTVGNQAVIKLMNSQARTPMPVLQRMRNPDDSPYPLNWGTLTFEEAWALLDKVHSGQLIAEDGDVQRLEAIMEQEDEEYEPGLDESLQEVVDQLTPGFTRTLKDRGGRKLPGRQVQGNLLEGTYSFAPIGSDNSNEVNANEYLMNMAGIDHVRDHATHPFVQDKMHLAPQTATTDTYRGHYRDRFKMSEKFLREYAGDGVKRRKIGAMLQSVNENEEWENTDLFQDIIDAVDEHKASVKEAEDDVLATEIPDIGDREELIEQVGNSIGFSVPSDIWEQLYSLHEDEEISKQEMDSYIRLDQTTEDFRDAFGQLSSFANPMSERKPKKEEEDYKPSSPKGGRKRKPDK